MCYKGVCAAGGDVMRIVPFIVVVLVAVSAASAATPDRTAQLRAASEKVLAATPEAAATWESLGDGALRHKPSGLVCPGDNLPMMPLTKLVITASPPPEHNGICDYESADGTKTTQLVATKVGETTPVEKILASMHNFIMQQYPQAKSLGLVSSILLPAAKGEAFAATVDDRSSIILLYVAVVKDWSVWTLVTVPDDNPTPKSASLVGMLWSGAFHVGVFGVIRTAQGIPEPRQKP